MGGVAAERRRPVFVHSGGKESVVAADGIAELQHGAALNEADRKLRDLLFEGCRPRTSSKEPRCDSLMKFHRV